MLIGRLAGASSPHSGHFLTRPFRLKQTDVQ
jgi:hypothetical protein